jgi:hypothetical protein
MYKDIIFRIIVYCVSIYFILIKKSVIINFCGWIILIAHIYKYTTNLVKWPYWCEFFGIILSLLLIISSIEINNCFVLFVGLLKLFAHFREIILNDGRYYY